MHTHRAAFTAPVMLPAAHTWLSAEGDESHGTGARCEETVRMLGVVAGGVISSSHVWHGVWNSTTASMGRKQMQWGRKEVWSEMLGGPQDRQ